MTQMLKKNCIETHKNMSYVRAVTLFGSEFLYDFTVENSKTAPSERSTKVHKYYIVWGSLG